MKTPILINCDDLGMHPDINDAILYLLKNTPIQSASLMANANHFGHAVLGLKKNGIHQVGIHLCMNSEYPKLPIGPLSPPEQVRSLVMPSGYFYPDMQDWDAYQASLEIHRQIEKFMNAGLEISHIDGHMFFYHEQREKIPRLLEVVEKLAKELKVPFRHQDPKQKIVFAWEGYESQQERFSFYEKAAHAATPWEEWILHPIHSTEKFSEISKAAHRRLYDYEYFCQDSTWKLFESLGVYCVSWEDLSFARKYANAVSKMGSQDLQIN